MPPVSGGLHTLVLYRSSARADEALRGLCRAAGERGSRVTVLSLAVEERPSSRCCDMRSVLWNAVCHELARDDLTRAAQALDEQAQVDFDVLVAPGRRVVSALAGEALARGADEIVLGRPAQERPGASRASAAASAQPCSGERLNTCGRSGRLVAH